MTEILPEVIRYRGKIYKLVSKVLPKNENDELELFVCGYYDDNDFPPHVHSDKFGYYLSAVSTSREDAYRVLLEKFNNITNK